MMALAKARPCRRSRLHAGGTTALLLVGLASDVSGAGEHKAPRQPEEPPAGNVALASAPPQKTPLHLPFSGAWGVLQGMDSQGTHTGYAAFALDFVPAERPVDERVYRKRKRLADHPCYGRPILAPAPGRVVWARDGARELPPFRESRRHEAGNFVIIEHAPDELTEFRHLQRGSIAVKVGDVVHTGQMVGRCGNSGNAVTPHVHMGFLGSYDPIATRPMRWTDYQVLKNGVWVRGEGVLEQGQIIRSVPEDTAGRRPQ
jgi:murein DD-endopeptidase MepM/ murein hydrolase activator NlpD